MVGKKQAVDGDDVVSAQLLRSENTQFNEEEAIMTVTFFRTTDLDRSVNLLRERTKKVVDANKWLLGSIIKKNKSLFLSWHPACDTEEHLASVFFVQKEPAGKPCVRHKGPYRELVKALACKTNPAYVGKGKTLTEQPNKRFFKVGVFRCGDDPGMFALAVSLSHTVGDGHTYYTLLNSFWEGGPAPSLNPHRFLGFGEEEKKTMGEKESKFFYSKLLMANFLWTYLRDKVVGKKANMLTLYIDESKVKALKEAAASSGEVPFVSTNDIVSSSFFRLAQARVNLMAVNLRNRLDGAPDVNDTAAGNYESILALGREDVGRPALLRKAMLKAGGVYRRAGSDPPSPLPGGVALLTSACCILTNWASFSKEPKLEGCELVSHLPTGDFTPMTSWSIGVIFRASPGRIAIMMAGPHLGRKGLEKALASHPGDHPYGEEVPGGSF